MPMPMPRRLLTSLRSLWNRVFVKLQTFIDKAVQVAGPTYILLAVCLISSVIYLFFTTILPTIHNVHSFQGIFHVLIAFWLILNVFFNYILCIYTDPGSPPDHVDYWNNQTPSQSRWCKHCQKHKPPFTHHCHICKRCILKMDHHCPWMHNCVGFYNYRFFFVFLLYLWIGCGYSMYMSSQLLFAENYSEQILFTFVLSMAIFGALSCLLGWHIFLVLSAQTTIDFYVNRQQKREAQSKGGEVWTNEYDLGKAQNFRNVFYCGGNRLWWLVLLLPSSSRPSGDGIFFCTRSRPRVDV